MTPQIFSRHPSESPDPQVGQHRQSMWSFQMIFQIQNFSLLCVETSCICYLLSYPLDLCLENTFAGKMSYKINAGRGKKDNAE